MTVGELIEELKRHPEGAQAEVFVDWPEDEHEESGWFDIDIVRPGGHGVEIRLVQ